MRTKYQSLRDFGYSFLGPILGTFIQTLYRDYRTTTPVCLAREGWAFEYVLNRAKKEGFLSELKDPIYLQLSRSLLFRILAGESDNWEHFLSRSAYSGTLKDLLINRFGMTSEEIHDGFSSEVLSLSVTLPDDSIKLHESLTPYVQYLKDYSAPSATAFYSYLDRIGLLDPGVDFTFLDVGYSGTIQTLLTLILKRNTKGKYFISCVPENNQISGYNAKIQGTFLENVKWKENHLMLERSLLLEALLTAPHGQVRDIRIMQDGKFQFFYGRPAQTQRDFQDVFTIFEGAGDCVIDMLRNKTVFSNEEVKLIFSAFASPLSAIPNDAAHLFHIDDDFSGNGLLRPKEMFGL